MRGRILAAAVLALLVSGAVEAGNTVMRGGAVYTLDHRHPWATAVVIEDGRIAYAGGDAGAAPYVHADSRVIDLAGRMVLPGFHDAHVHPMSAGLRLLRCQLAGLADADAVYAAVHACAAVDKHEWFIGGGLPLAAFGVEGPAREKLDALVPDRPAFLSTDEGFAAWANTKALVAAGIDPQTVSGSVTGEKLDALWRTLPRATESEFREALRRTAAILNRFGVTSVFDASASEAMLNAYHAADRAGELTVRVVAAQRVDVARGPDQVNDFVARRERTAGPRFRATAAKIFLDGEIDLHTASMLAPYANTNERGPTIPQDALSAIVRRLDAAGFDIHMHAMGDGAVRAGLDAVADAARVNGPRDRRPQIAHVGVADPSDLPRFAKLGVAANFTPGWFPANDPAAAPNAAALGRARSRWIMPAASIAARHGMIVLSSDWPAASMNPLEGMQWAITRQPLDGHLPPRLPEQRITLATAIAAYTRNAAYVAREDAIDGTIEAGKAADLVVLDRNLFKIDVMQVHAVHVVLTLLDGEPVYRDAGFVW